MDDRGGEAERLAGERVLVVEDQYLVAESLRFLLESLGALVLGPAPTVERALELAREPLDAAVLDLDLRGESSVSLAGYLLEHGVAVVFLTGYEPATSLPEALRSQPFLSKPAGAGELARALCDALAARRRRA